MGFKDAEWAYSLDLPSGQKVVLVAICHRTNDKTHQTFVSQGVVADMVGMTARGVRNLITALEESGLIRRDERRRKDGYRDTDLVTVNTEWSGAIGNVVPGNEVPRNQIPGNDVPISPETHDSEAVTTFRASSSKELLVSQGHSVVTHSPDRFGEFYATWPQKRDRPAAARAWAKAIVRAAPEIIIAAAIAYRDNPGIKERRFIPYPATWLNRDGWLEDLDEPASSSPVHTTPTDRAVQSMAKMLGTQHPNITALPQRGISA